MRAFEARRFTALPLPALPITLRSLIQCCSFLPTTRALYPASTFKMRGFLMVAAVACAAADQTGAQISMSQAGVQYILEAAIPLVEVRCS